MTASLAELRYDCERAAEKIETLPIEKWHCWVDFIMEELDVELVRLGTSPAARQIFFEQVKAGVDQRVEAGRW